MSPVSHTRADEDWGAEIVGQSPGLLRAKEMVRRVARTDIAVLILGETGTGKELFTQYIHRLSGRTGPLVEIDCGAIPDDLFEGLLFGHRRGAFTGAVDTQSGMIELAHRGTLFLDELPSLSPRAQAKLLRVLETREVRRIGEVGSRRVAFRLVSTSQRSLGARVDAGDFRDDLLNRAAGFVIQLPALAERREDIPLLAHHFAGRCGVRLSVEAAAALGRWDWPGNVRQLKGLIERSAVFAPTGTIDQDALSFAVETGPRLLSARQAPQPPTGNGAAHLTAVCRRHGGDPEKIAEDLGIGRSTLYRWLRKSGLELRRFRPPANAS
jgi:transcriptional regulator with PAS, ATPase and Fis domain